MDPESGIKQGVTVTETINEDGSKTITQVTVHEDGSKSTKRKTIRSKSPKRPTTRSKSPVPNAKPALGTRSVSMEGALEEALNEDANGHKDNEAFEQAVRRCIPSEFVLIASQDDESQAQEAFLAAKIFNLPNPIGDAGSVATSALVEFLYQNADKVVAGGAGKPIPCLTVLQEMNARMKKATKFDIQPQISSSRPLGPPRLGNKYAPFYIVPPEYTGKRRALLIGVKFQDDEEEKRLKGPHNDVHNVQQFLVQHCGFAKEDMFVLKDDGQEMAPTKQNILDSFQKVVDLAQPKDVLFIQYSGHGGRVKDKSGDEADGYDSYILPSDYKTVGQILDDDILKDLIKAIPAGVFTTMLVDCCNSGTVGDLPYILKANTQRDQEIERFFDTDTSQEILEKEAQAGREVEEWHRAKAERKKQRELRKKREEAEQTASRNKAEQTASRNKAEQDAAEIMQQMHFSDCASQPAPILTYTQAQSITHNFTIKSEEEVPTLSKQLGVAISLIPEQKNCLKLGGTVTLSLTVQQPQPVATSPARSPQKMIPGGVVMMTLEQAEAFKKANGGVLMMSPEQAAAFAKMEQQ